MRVSHVLRGLIALGFAGGLLLAGGSVAGAVPPGTLDQQVAGPGDLGAAVWETQSLAQVFTAGITGTLTGVVVNVAETGNPAPTGNLVVAIESVTGSGLSAVPSGTVLGQTTLTPSQVTNGANSVTFKSVITSTSGTQYAIVLSDTTDPNGQYLWGGSDTANYQGGSGEYNRGSGWLVETPTTKGAVYFVFQTYVQLAAPSSIQQCTHGGWQTFPQFTSQKQCTEAVRAQRKG